MLSRGSDKSERWINCLNLAKKALLTPKNYKPENNKITHYYNPKAVESDPAWANVYEKVKVVGNHHFYKAKDGKYQV